MDLDPKAQSTGFEIPENIPAADHITGMILHPASVPHIHTYTHRYASLPLTRYLIIGYSACHNTGDGRSRSFHLTSLFVFLSSAGARFSGRRVGHLVLVREERGSAFRLPRALSQQDFMRNDDLLCLLVLWQAAVSA
jgi:hypothetical protein